MTGAWFGVLIQQTGERHGCSESSVDLKYFGWNRITAELRVNGGRKLLRWDPVNR